MYEKYPQKRTFLSYVIRKTIETVIGKKNKKDKY
jgi:hypothetical protein